MKTYQVTYTLPPHEKGQIYECQAESTQHANGLCTKEHPEAHIVLVQDMTPQVHQKLVRSSNFVNYYVTIIADAFRDAAQLDATFDISVHFFAGIGDDVAIKVSVTRNQSYVFSDHGKYRKHKPIPTRNYFLMEETDTHFIFQRSMIGKAEVVKVPIPSAYRVTDPQNPTLEECKLMLADDPVTANRERDRRLRRAFNYGPRSVIIRDYELLHFAYQQADELLANSMLWRDPRNDDTPTDALPDLGSTATKMSEYHAEHGLWQSFTAGVIYFDPDQADMLYSTAELIMAEYDNCEGDGRQPTWEKFELGGDDDVDYNGGHVMAFIELLQFYVKKKGLA